MLTKKKLCTSSLETGITLDKMDFFGNAPIFCRHFLESKLSEAMTEKQRRQLLKRKLYFNLFYFQEFMLNLLNKVYDHLGFRPKKSDTRLDVYTRNYVLKYACKFGHKQCIADARTEFDHSMRASYK